MPAVAHPAVRSRWPAVLVATGVAATAAGLVLHDTWRVLPAERFALSLVLGLLAMALAWPVKRLSRCPWATAIAVVWLVGLVVYVGPLPVLAAALFALAALAIGLRITPASLPARAAVSATTGLILMAGLTGWVVTLPMHTRWLWLVVLVALIALQRNALAHIARDTARGWRDAVDSAPRLSALCVMLLGLASTACWLPTMQMDDLTYHLGLPTQLLLHGRYAPAPAYQIWSFAPWAGDVLHGIAFVLAGRDAHGAVNALWLMLAAGAAWSLLASLRATAHERWASLALFATLPTLVWISAGMQTELAATAVTLALAAVIATPMPVTGPHERLWAGTVLFAGLFALKLMHGVAALPLVLYAAWCYRPVWPWRRWALALLLFAVLALSSYVQSGIATGNPVLPLFNDVFHSPYFPLEAFGDPRWHAGFGPDLLWRMTFDTDRYVEGWDGGFGFVLIALAGLWLLHLLRPGRRAVFLAATACLLLPLLPMQYARYAFPGLALLTVMLPIGAETAFGRRALLGLVIGLCLLDLAYQANASWLHHSAAIKRTLRSGGDADAVLPAYIPERLLLRGLPRDDDGLVLATDPARGFVAELAGRGRVVSEHDPSMAAAAAHANGDTTGAEWAALFARERIRWVLVNADNTSPALRAGLAQTHAQRYVRLPPMELWRRDDHRARTSSVASP